jgi:hypothetical protein
MPSKPQHLNAMPKPNSPQPNASRSRPKLPPLQPKPQRMPQVLLLSKHKKI